MVKVSEVGRFLKRRKSDPELYKVQFIGGFRSGHVFGGQYCKGNVLGPLDRRKWFIF